MQSKTLKVLLIEDSPEYAELVQSWLSSGTGEIAFALNWTDLLAGGLERLARGGVDVILLDLNLPDSNGLETFLKTRAQAKEIPIIVLSAADSESLALRMIQEGAEDYLVKSTCTRELLVRAARYAVIRHKHAGRVGAASSSEPCRVIGVIGAKGGVGTTTLACNLAAELREQTGGKVLLADLDIHAGLVSFFMNPNVKYSILDALSELNRLDYSSWEQLVGKSADDLHVLPSPGLMGAEELPTENIRHLIEIVRPVYEWMVLDVGRLPGITKLLDLVTEVFVVTTTALASLYESKRVIDALVRTGIEGDRLRLVLNELEPAPALSGRALDQVFGTEVYARLPRDNEALHDACLHQKLPAQNSNIRRQIAGLARRMAGLPEPRTRRTLRGLWSLSGKFRRTAEPGAEMNTQA